MTVLLLLAGAVYEFGNKRTARHVILYAIFSAAAVILSIVRNPEISIINIIGGICR